MRLIHGASVLVGVPLACLLLGLWLGQRLGLASPNQRIAASILAGLGVLLASLAAFNLFCPLESWTAWTVLAPAMLTLARPAGLRDAFGDLRAMLFSGGGPAFAAAALVFLALALGPLMVRPGAIFYDGTANHDAFFWITGAEYLQTHSYLVVPEASAPHPLNNAVTAFTGLSPAWGRMGAEGYIGWVSSVAGRSPLLVYLWASAALYIAWLAAVCLVARTFITIELRWPAAAALAALQPHFAFYHHNANLPNLLGMLAGATLVLTHSHGLHAAATARREWRGWLVFGALAWHGLLCTYPEMVPFILLPCGLITGRAWLGGATQAERNRLLAFAAAMLLAGAVLNPVTTWRAAHGFWVSFFSARTNEGWANIFSSVGPSEFIPALLTLSPKAGRELGGLLGCALTFGMIGAIALAWWRARDRTGLALVMSGAGALALYTAVTEFHYGWQKTVQFSGVFLAAMLPVGTMELLLAERRWHRLARMAALGIAGFFVYAQAIVGLDLWKWSGRKSITADWQELAEVQRAIAGKPVVIEAATFPHAFFQGMWSVYFLRDAAVFFATRGHENGGYLRATVATEDPGTPPAAILVSREWAETLDANAPRIAAGRDWVLLSRANRVHALEGTAPASGVPRTAASNFSLSITPAADAKLEVALRATDATTRGCWRATVELEGHASDRELAFDGTVWRGGVPLVGGATQRIVFSFIAAEGGAASPDAFAIERLVLGSGER